MGVPCSHSRLCAILLNDGVSKTLVLNTYMPCDGSDGLEEYCDVLNNAAMVINKVNPNHIVFGGDYNTDVIVGKLESFSNLHQNIRCVYVLMILMQTYLIHL